MKAIEFYHHEKTVLSIEIFPPRPDLPINTVYETLDRLKVLNPDFISVTYGAGGGNRARTIEISSKIKNTYGIEALSHLTCVASTSISISGILQSLKDEHIENIMALRGDVPKDIENFSFADQEFKHAGDLISYIKERSDFCIGAACYPEVHIESSDKHSDIEHLKTKVDSGVDFLVTQLFFDNGIFYSFLEDARNAGITCPVSTGIMPVFSTSLIKRLTLMCGASIPKKLVRILNKYENKPEELSRAGVDYAVNQIRDLIDHGVDGIHLLTMNKAEQTIEIVRALDMG